MYGPKSGGLKTTLNELSNQYCSAGHKVLVIVPGERTSQSPSSLISRLEIASPKIPRSGGYRMIFNLRLALTALKDFNPDVIEISDRTTLLLVSLWAKYKKIPTIFFAHERLDGVLNSFLPSLPFKSGLVRIWNRLTESLFTNIIATTKYAAAEFQSLGSAKLKIVPLGVDLTTFVPDYSELPINLDDKYRGYLVTATRVSKEKDPELILDIARELKRREINLPILAYGAGPELFKMQNKAHLEQLNIFYLGYIANKRQLAEKISRGDIYLAPGPIETFGLAALEALACGTPVICRDSSALSEIITPESGFALPRDPAIWVDSILDLLAGDRNAQRISARRRAEEFEWSTTAEKLLAIHRNNLKSSVTTPAAPSFTN